MATGTVVQQQSPFSLTYNTPTVDIGSAYAQGIGQAGASIADALKGVTSIMNQNQTANDMLTGLSQMKDSQGNPILSPDDYDAIASKGLGAKQQFIGELMGRFHTQYAAQLEQQQKLQQIQTTAAASAPYRQAEIAATGEQQRKTAELEAKLQALKNPDSRLIKNPPLNPNAPTPPASGADNIKSPLQMTLDQSKNPRQFPNLLPQR
jgi:hypothetical protein